MADKNRIDLLLPRQSFLREFKELLFPPPQPELKLESKPIPIRDIWSADERSRSSRIGSVLAHLAVIGVLFLPLWRVVQPPPGKPLDVPVFVPPPAPPPVTLSARPLAESAAAARIERPAVQTQAIRPFTAPAMIASLANAMGGVDPNLFSGPGPIGGAVGNGAGARGPGGNGGVCGGADCAAAEGVEPPVLISSPDPEYSDEARKAKYQGTVTVLITIAADGRVTSARVADPIGMGLDQKAVAAVLQWRFQPARSNGQPVPVQAQVQVNFRLY